MMGIKVQRILSVITALALSFVLVGHASAGAPQYPISEDTEVILPAPEIPAEDTVEIPLPIVPESEEPTEALTPEGNMTLVDDVETETETGKQFLTVVTKDGNYFYLIIDRTADGENTVHFLNQVDEEDLLALIETEDKEETPIVCSCLEKCMIGSINTACELCMTEMVRCIGEAPEPVEPEEPEEPEVPEPEKKTNTGLLLIVLLFLAAGGGAAFYFLILKPKRRPPASDPLEDYDPDEEYYEEPEGRL